MLCGCIRVRMCGWELVSVYKLLRFNYHWQYYKLTQLYITKYRTVVVGLQNYFPRLGLENQYRFRCIQESFTRRKITNFFVFENRLLIKYPNYSKFNNICEKYNAFYVNFCWCIYCDIVTGYLLSTWLTGYLNYVYWRCISLEIRVTSCTLHNLG